MDASRGDSVQAFVILIEEFGVQLDCEDTLGRQAVHHAAQAGAVSVLECLTDHGADLNKKASVNLISPLHYAAKVLRSQHGVIIGTYPCLFSLCPSAHSTLCL